MVTQPSLPTNKAMRRGETLQRSRDKTERAHDILRRRRRPVLERPLGLPEGDTSMLEVSG